MSTKDATPLGTPLDWALISNPHSGKAMLVLKTGSVELRPDGRVIWLYRAGKRIGRIPSDITIKQCDRTDALMALANRAWQV
jgi:hypothetical protein